jgi:hypothetical protein
MDVRKIIKEEIDSFDWTDDATVEDGEKMEIAKEYFKFSYEIYDDLVPEFEKEDGFTHYEWVEDVHNNFARFWSDEEWVEEEYRDIKWFNERGVTTRDDMTRIIGMTLSLF